MKKKKDFMVGRTVRVPSILTKDPLNKKGCFGVIISSDFNQNTIQVAFEDGVNGPYQLDALEILYTPKAMTYHLNARIRELNQTEVDAIRRIINFATCRDFKKAFALATISHVVWEICITDTGTFYSMKKNVRKCLGISKGL